MTNAVAWGILLAFLPEHFWDGFGGAVLGGILVAGGGYLATRQLRLLDIERAKEQAVRDYQAAVVVVSDELHANRAIADNLTQGSHFVTDPSSIGLSEASYLAVEHFLADRLPPATRNALANAYAEIRARGTLFGPLTYQMVVARHSFCTRGATQNDHRLAMLGVHHPVVDTTLTPATGR